MIFADKLVALRKKFGWSQEELAEKIEVTRQSVSKWESAQSLPDVDKIILLSEIFNVSIDYLLKNNIEEEINTHENNTVKSVSAEDVENFIKLTHKNSIIIPLGIVLCIISPIILLLLSVLSEAPDYMISEGFAAGIGLSVMFLLIALAVAVFVFSSIKSEPYIYFDKETLYINSKIKAAVNSQKTKYDKKHCIYCIIGTVICIISIIPLFIGIVIDEKNDVLLIGMLSLSFIIASIGTALLSHTHIIFQCYQKILQDVDYKNKKRKL